MLPSTFVCAALHYNYLDTTVVGYHVKRFVGSKIISAVIRRRLESSSFCVVRLINLGCRRTHQVEGGHGSVIPANMHEVFSCIDSSSLPAQDVEFSPPLPEAKVTAFQRMGMCSVVKVILKFDRPVLPPLLHGCICSESFIPEFWFRYGKVYHGLTSGRRE